MFFPTSLPRFAGESRIRDFRQALAHGPATPAGDLPGRRGRRPGPRRARAGVARRRPRLAVGHVRGQHRRHGGARVAAPARAEAAAGPGLARAAAGHRAVRRADDLLDAAARDASHSCTRACSARRRLRPGQHRSRAADRLRWSARSCAGSPRRDDRRCSCGWASRSSAVPARASASCSTCAVQRGGRRPLPARDPRRQRTGLRSLLGLLHGAGVTGDALLLSGTALLGSFTTFSTWMVQSERLAAEGDGGLALVNVARQPRRRPRRRRARLGARRGVLAEL